MKQRTENEIKADIAKAKGRRAATALLLCELQQAVVRRLKSEVREKAKLEREAKRLAKVA